MREKPSSFMTMHCDTCARGRRFYRYSTETAWEWRCGICNNTEHGHKIVRVKIEVTEAERSVAAYRQFLMRQSDDRLARDIARLDLSPHLTDGMRDRKHMIGGEQARRLKDKKRVHDAWAQA